jgi:adenylate cyclase
VTTTPGHTRDEASFKADIAWRSIIVADIVESVRLMEQGEGDFIRRWRAFVNEIRSTLLAKHEARLVKSLGDGLLIECKSAPKALALALALCSCSDRHNAGLSAGEAMLLRIGLHAAEVVIDEIDVYGVGVNLAARLTTLARPGGIVVSSQFADHLAQGVDAELEDLGYCYLKHLSEPIHAFSVTASGAVSSMQLSPLPLQRGPTIAVLPFSAAGDRDQVGVIGEALADSVIGQLSASHVLGVISRLSTSALRARCLRALEIGKLLGCTFILSGTYRESGDKLDLSIELTDAKREQVIWAEEFAGRKTEVLSIQSELTQALCARIVEALLQHEIRRVSTRPLPTLEAFELQLTGAMLMHHATRASFERGREVLEHLLERFPRAAVPRAWLAKWYVLRVSRGFVQDMQSESARALDHTHRALDNSPDCSLALAVEGFVHCHMLRDLDTADERLDEALALNPNDSLAWIFKCATLTFRGAGKEALQAGQRAVALSPIDPMKHYYDGLMSSAAVAGNELQLATELAQRSLRMNRDHLPTLRALTIAQVESGDVDEARKTAQRILELDPSLTARLYIERAPKGGEVPRQRFARALVEAGIPAG